MGAGVDRVLGQSLHGAPRAHRRPRAPVGDPPRREHAEAAACRRSEVAGGGADVAGHVHEPSRRDARKQLDDLRVQTRARRIDDYELRLERRARLAPREHVARAELDVAKAVFLGINYSFNDFIQAVHRIFRFLQTREVEIHIIHSEAEREIVNGFLK